MNNQGSIRPFHGRLDFAPFVGVLFLGRLIKEDGRPVRASEVGGE